VQALRQADIDAGVGVLIVRLIEGSSGLRADCPVCHPPGVGTGWMRSLRAELPNTPLAAKLALELRLCPGIDREDAVQEAWLAALEGRNPARAVNTFAQRERRHRRRETAMHVEGVKSFRISALRAARIRSRNGSAVRAT
jgi:hypothetical protein